MYQQLEQDYQNQLETIKRKYNIISLIRLLVGVLFLMNAYFAIKEYRDYYFFIGVLLIAFFIGIMRFHKKVDTQRKLTHNLLKINATERAYINDKKLPFENGSEYIDFTHEYAYDLDIFGNDSLFQHLNRAATFIGKKTLAHQLLSHQSHEQIIQNQEAIKELSKDLTWRQGFEAHAQLSSDSEKLYDKLKKWSSRPSAPISKLMQVLSFVTPLLFIAAITTYFITDEYVFLSISSFVFVFNLGLLGQFFK